LYATCRDRGWWELSLLLLGAVEGAGGSPSLQHINGVIAACAAGGAAQQAAQAFAKLAQYGLAPSPDSYLQLVSAHCNAGQWVQAAAEYKRLLHAG
jgi:hypothetical protein